MAEPGRERIIQANPLASAGGRVIVSPFQFYMDGATNIRIEGWNSLTGVSLQVFGRTFKDDGHVQDFQAVLPLTADRVRTVGDFAVARGYLLNLVMFVTGGVPQFGQTFARVSIIRGLTGATVVMGTLLQGYCAGSQALAWPGSPVQHSLEGRGVARQVTGTAPAVGAECAETVPTGARWYVDAMHVEFQADATAGDRLLSVSYHQAVTNRRLMRSVAPQIVIPTQGTQQYWAIGMPIVTILSNTATSAGLPIDMPLIAGTVVRTITENLRAGDFYSAPIMALREFLEAQ